MNKDEQFLANRIRELANIAYERNIYTYSDFLNINEINIFEQIKNSLPPVSLKLTGGNNYAERKILIFSARDIYYDETEPIDVIKIVPANVKFTDKLSHRDYLGAVLNLGINRNKTGDIFVSNEAAYLYCKSEISDFIIDNLFKIRHTQVKLSKFSNENIDITPDFQEIVKTIANVRLDSLIAMAFNSSRNSIISYIQEQKVFINGRLTVSNGSGVNPGDIVSVRGKGRFIYDGIIKETKKGRNLVKIRLYS
jgi:RNA-binding protein YlmH